MIDWLYPLALVLLPLPWLMRWLPPRRQRRALIIPDRLAELLRALGGSMNLQSRLQDFSALAGIIGWCALVLALATPLTGRTPLPHASGRDLIVTLDLSVSMLATDVMLAGRPVARIDAVKALAGDFIRRRDGDRIGLIAFADHPFLIAPPTYDIAEVGVYLDEIDVGLPGRKTAVGDAIGMGVLQLEKQPASARVLLLLTDGSSNSGSLAPAAAARLAREHGIRIHTIGFGSDSGKTTDIDDDQLANLASQTGGQHFTAQSTAELQDVYRVLDQIEPVASTETLRYAQRDWTRELLILAFAMLVAAQLSRWVQQR